MMREEPSDWLKAGRSIFNLHHKVSMLNIARPSSVCCYSVSVTVGSCLHCPMPRHCEQCRLYSHCELLHCQRKRGVVASVYTTIKHQAVDWALRTNYLSVPNIKYYSQLSRILSRPFRGWQICTWLDRFLSLAWADASEEYLTPLYWG